MNRNRTHGEAPTARKVVVDTDAGVDDALALMLLAADPDVELLAVLSVFGSAGSDRTADNARYVLDVCGRTDVPVVRGCASPLGQAARFSPSIHGHDGFGNSGLRPAHPVPAGPDASSVLIELVRTHPGEIDYVGLGPLTNLASALRTAPETMTGLRSATIVGSLGPALYEDTEPWADRRFRVSRDANVSRDIESAETVARYRGDVTWCGPYVTRQVLVPEDFFAKIAEETGSAAPGLITRISGPYADFYSRSYPQPDGRRVMGINDSIAVAALTRPELVTGAVLRPMQTFVDPERGERYLAGVHPATNDARPSHRVVFDMDFAGVIALIRQVLRRPLPWR